MLTYNPDLHAMPTSHTKRDTMPSLDFISRWERYELHNTKELEEVLDRNLVYRKEH